VALGFFDFFGFGSKRRTALQVLDRTLVDLEVNLAYMDDGMRFAIYKWAQEAEAQSLDDKAMDHFMRDAAALISFCVLGPAETEALWGATVRDARQARFDAVIDKGEDETFDARLIKLVLAKGNAAPDIRARVELET
jgi:hypothetical protein